MVSLCWLLAAGMTAAQAIPISRDLLRGDGPEALATLGACVRGIWDDLKLHRWCAHAQYHTPVTSAVKRDATAALE
jgi:hypothetical protein